MLEVGLSEEANRSEDSCGKALDGDEEKEVKSRGAVALNSMPIFLPVLLFCPSQHQGEDNWESDSWKILALVIIKPVGLYRLVYGKHEIVYTTYNV